MALPLPLILPLVFLYSPRSQLFNRALHTTFQRLLLFLVLDHLQTDLLKAGISKVLFIISQEPSFGNRNHRRIANIVILSGSFVYLCLLYFTCHKSLSSSSINKSQFFTSFYRLLAATKHRIYGRTWPSAKSRRPLN